MINMCTVVVIPVSQCHELDELKHGASWSAPRQEQHRDRAKQQTAQPTVAAWSCTHGHSPMYLR